MLCFDRWHQFISRKAQRNALWEGLPAYHDAKLKRGGLGYLYCVVISYRYLTKYKMVPSSCCHDYYTKCQMQVNEYCEEEEKE